VATATRRARRAAARHTRSRRRRILVRSLIALIALWVVSAAVVCVLGLLHASHGMGDISDAKSQLSASDVVSRSATVPLRKAMQQFQSASGLLHSPLLAPLDIVPVIGRQLRSVQDLSSASAQVARIGVSAIGAAHGVLSAPHTSGPQRVSALRNLSALARDTDRQLARIDTGPAHALFPVLDTKHDTFVRDLDDVRSRLEHATEVAGTMADILQGPQTYLLVMANNAEMRAGSGDFLEVGVLSTHDGHLSLSSVTPTATIPVPAGLVSVGGDLEARWGWLKPGRDWRNLGYTPQFDVNAPLAAQMWEAETAQHVDGVMMVDLEALRQFLEVTGPVTLANGSVVGPSEVVQLLAHDQYEGLTDALNGPNALEASREERLGSLARATLNALQDESLDLRSLADAVTAATQGRHLLAWSAQPSAEAAWVEGGVAGELAPTSLLTAVVSQGGNKLDPYLGVDAGLQLRARGSATEVVLTITLHNRTPPGQSQFIAGPYPGLGTVYGEYRGLLAVNVPGYASKPRIDGAPVLDALGAEGPTWVIAAPVDVKAGGSQRVVVRFTMPGTHRQMTVVPTARIDPVAWTYQGATRTDSTPFTVTW
jgi:hypothetical protein